MTTTELSVEEHLKATWSIRPLEWKRSFQDWQQAYTAEVVGGSYMVGRTREDCDPSMPWQGWRWEYHFKDYYDEGYSECANAAEGKILAQADWIKRITPALILQHH